MEGLTDQDQDNNILYRYQIFHPLYEIHVVSAAAM